MQLPKIGEPVHFYPCTLSYESECDECGKKIPQLGERWLAQWAELLTTDGVRPVSEIKVFVRCGACQDGMDGKDILAKFMRSLWKEGKKDEAPSCPTPRRAEGGKTRVYLPGTPAHKD